MSHRLHVVGFRPPDETWHRMKAAYDACNSANVPIPKEVDDYFGDEEPDPSGVEIKLTNHECCEDYSPEMVEGFEVDLTKLPKGITKLRFTVNW